MTLAVKFCDDFLKVDGVPESDRRNDKIQSACSVSLVLERPISELAESIEEHSASKGILGLSLAQSPLRSLA